MRTAPRDGPDASDWFDQAAAQCRAAVFSTARLAADSPPRPFRLGDRVFALFGSELNACVKPWYPWPASQVIERRDRFVSGVLVGDDSKAGTTLIYTGTLARPSEPPTLALASARLACPCSAGLGDQHVRCEWAQTDERARQGARAIQLRAWFQHLSTLAPDGRVLSAPKEMWVAMAGLEAFGIVSTLCFGPATYGHRDYYVTGWANAGAESAWPGPATAVPPALSRNLGGPLSHAAPRTRPQQIPGSMTRNHTARPSGLASDGGICP
ncbi:MAG: hypothetical protein ACRDWV_10710 [Acidimicrobiales bacterium]